MVLSTRIRRRGKEEFRSVVCYASKGEESDKLTMSETSPSRAVRKAGFWDRGRHPGVRTYQTTASHNGCAEVFRRPDSLDNFLPLDDVSDSTAPGSLSNGGPHALSSTHLIPSEVAPFLLSIPPLPGAECGCINERVFLGPPRNTRMPAATHCRPLDKIASTVAAILSTQQPPLLNLFMAEFFELSS